MGYKCFKCGKEVRQAVRLEKQDYCYHCADIKQKEMDKNKSNYS